MCCNADKDNLYEHVDVSPSSSGPFKENVDGDYEHAAAACEINVVLDEEGHRNILAAELFYDKRDSGGRGLCL